LPDARTVFAGIAGERLGADPRLDGLLEAVDRVPLAVELLAYNAQAEPDLAGLVSRWEQERVALLRRAGGAAKELSVAVSVELSVTSPLMGQDGRRLLTLLGHLPDGIAHQDLAAVLPDAGLRGAANLRHLGLAFDEAGRLRALAPIREHVAAEHAPADDDLLQLIGHYCSLAAVEGGRVGRSGGGDAARRLAAETGNITHLVEMASSATDGPTSPTAWQA
jgi:hypothetical protein